MTSSRTNLQVGDTLHDMRGLGVADDSHRDRPGSVNMSTATTVVAVAGLCRYTTSGFGFPLFLDLLSLLVKVGDAFKNGRYTIVRKLGCALFFVMHCIAFTFTGLSFHQRVPCS